MSGPEPGARPEALFYHLTATPLEQALPELLEKCLARGWRVTLRAGGPARVEALALGLWTYRDDSFLPHGDASDGRPERQPIWLTAGPEKPNDPEVLFLVDGAAPLPGEFAEHVRTVLMFDGHDGEAVAAARGSWRLAVEAGCKATYQAQEGGRWVKKAESA